LWHGSLPDAGQHSEMKRRVGRARVEAFESLDVDAVAAHDDPMDALRASVGGMHIDSSATLEEQAIAVWGRVPVALAVWSRARHGDRSIAPDASASHAADVLRMLTGEAPSEGAARMVDAYLTTVSEHGMNASTFTARVIASTGSDLVSAITGAIGALKGPLHGGAPGPVLDMLDAIGAPELAEPWIRAELSQGRRIMGMGHRVYRVRDPRAAIFEQALERWADDTPRRALALATEAAATRVLAERYPERGLQANVEFYTSVLLEAAGVPRELFTPLFAVGRAVGWAAHVREQRETGRLLRPLAMYVGDDFG
ncbi:MAG: citrate/2-methylcitrate synthase, partial [Myxococcota bacterium]